jgi:hypothetical protein
MNIPDFLGLKLLKFFDADGIRILFAPGSGMEIIGSGIKIPDLQHCFLRDQGCHAIFFAACLNILFLLVDTKMGS